MSDRHRSQKTFSEEISDFVASTRIDRIPRRVREIAKLHLLDGLATMLGGAREESSRVLLLHCLASKSKPEATVIGTAIKLSAEQAALINGVQGHVLDYDDAQLTSDASRPMGQQTHPTSPILGAAFALAESRHASGAELLAAYIAGVEVACCLGDAIDPSHYLNGLHPTGTLGVFGAAAACAYLLKLEPRAIRHALGIGGTLSSGLRANRGPMAKGLNAGHAAQSGVLAARLAARGFTASENIFDESMGFFEALCQNRFDRKLLRFGRPFFFEKPGVAIKLYPCAGVLHPALDSVLDLRARHNIATTDIERIEVALDSRAALPLVYNNPQDTLQAKFSLPFALAAALVDGAAGLHQFSAARLHDTAIRTLMKRTELVRRTGPRSRQRIGINTEIAITLRGGAIHRASASIARGHPQKAATRADIEEKFRQCAAGVLSPRAVARFLKNFPALEHAPSIRAWLGALRPAR
jgi:2-methylcitrate dehydratase PrpD